MLQAGSVRVRCIEAGSRMPACCHRPGGQVQRIFGINPIEWISPVDELERERQPVAAGVRNAREAGPSSTQEERTILSISHEKLQEFSDGLASVIGTPSA